MDDARTRGGGTRDFPDVITTGFRTAIGKVYPEALNQALADSVADYALSCGPQGQWLEPLPELFFADAVI